MTDDLERQLREHVLEGDEVSSFDVEDAADRARQSRWCRLLLAAADDASLHVTWARPTEWEALDAAGRVARVRAQLPAVDRHIDAAIESDEPNSVLEALARAGVGWEHDVLPEHLETEATLESTASVMARGMSDTLRSTIITREVVDEALTALRAAALEGADDLWDQFLIWRTRLEPDEDEELDELSDVRRRHLHRLDGLGAILGPTLYARGVLTGDYETRWFEHSEAVADLLQVCGATDWLEVLGLLEATDSRATEMASTLAVCAAQGLGDEPPDEDETERLLDLLGETPDPHQKESPWEEMATRLGLGLQIAVGEDEFGLLLAQVAAHERLVTHGIHSPGIPGLPLSATAPEDIDHPTTETLAQELADRLLADEDESRDEAIVSAVRTLCDARTWLRRFPEEFEPLARAVASSFEPVEVPPVDLAYQQLEDALEDRSRDETHTSIDGSPSLREAMRVTADAFAPEPSDAVLDRLATRATEAEDVLAMDCARRLAAVGTQEALERLGDLWVERAPVLRAPFVRLAMMDGLVEMSGESGDA